MNNYQYAPNPVGWVDPLGLTCKEIPDNYDILNDRYQNAILNLDPADEVVAKSVERLAKARNVPIISRENIDQLKNVKVLTLVCHGEGNTFYLHGKPVSGSGLGELIRSWGFTPEGIEAVACQRELGPARQELANTTGVPVLGGLGRMAVTNNGNVVVWNEQATTINPDGTENTVLHSNGQGKKVYQPIA